MDICYLILAHKNPEQLRRLVERLTGNGVFFYLHIDKNVSLDLFRSALPEKENLVYVRQREAGTWGDIGIVKGTLNGLQQILEDGRTGHCVLLSGQDYPLHSTQKIADLLLANPQTSFADTWQLPAERWYSGGMDRIEQYKFNLKGVERNYLMVPPVVSANFFRQPASNLRKVFLLLKKGRLPLQLLRKRKFPAGIEPHGGSQWWSVPTELAQNILSFVKKHKNYFNYYKFTLLPDEVFFQSLIVHFCKKQNRPLKPSLTYLRWENKQAAHPITFALQHCDELIQIRRKQPEKLFARKFEFENEILCFIDNLNGKPPCENI